MVGGGAGGRGEEQNKVLNFRTGSRRDYFSKKRNNVVLLPFEGSGTQRDLFHFLSDPVPYSV